MKTTDTDNKTASAQPEKRITVDTITLPSIWASALINGDFSGLDDDETRRCQLAIDAMVSHNESVVSMVDDSERFTWHYRLYDPNISPTVNGGTVADYVIFIS